MSKLLPLAIKPYNSIFQPTTCTDLVHWLGKLHYTLGLPKFTNFLRDMRAPMRPGPLGPSYLSPYTMGNMVVLLGDTIRLTINNTRARIKQSKVHFEYFWFVFMELSHYCSGMPFPDPSVLNGVRYSAVAFVTRTFLCITMLYNMFVVEAY